jgi:antitoxin HigA-1
MTMTAEQKAILASTPGRILEEEFLKGFGLSQAELSRRTGIPRSTLNEIIKGRRPIQAEVAYALGLFFRMEPQFWMNLQGRYEMRRVEFGKGSEIRSRVQPLPVS